MGRKEREPIRGFCRPIPIYLGRACARMASALPEGGADLLAFKRQASEARDLHADAIGDANPFGVANPGILDDPLERIAELEGFDELDGDGDDHQRDALQHVHEASRVRAAFVQLRPDEAELEPYLAAVQHELDAEQAIEPELPVTLLPHLLLGDQFSAWDAERLVALGVTHVVNCAGAAARGPLDHAALGIDYCVLEAEDDVAYDILQHRAQVAERAHRCREQGGRCLLHCSAGINRSGALAAAEMMVSEQRPLLETVARLQAARGDVLRNRSFRIALVRLARDEGLLGALPGSDAPSNVST